MVAARRFRDLRTAGAFLLGFGMVMPLLHGALGVALGSVAGLSMGGSTVLGVMAASASYIAAPAAVRIALPEANPGYYLTAALAMIPGVDPKMCRKPEIVADAAHAVLVRDARQHTGNFYLDEQVLAAAGVTDLDPYAVVPGTKHFLPDLFLD